MKTILKEMQKPQFNDGESSFFNILEASMTKEDVKKFLSHKASREDMEKCCGVVIYRFFKYYQSISEYDDCASMKEDLSSLISFIVDSRNNHQSYFLLELVFPQILKIIKIIIDEIKKGDTDDLWNEELISVFCIFPESQTSDFDFHLQHRKDFVDYFFNRIFNMPAIPMKNFLDTLNGAIEDTKRKISDLQKVSRFVENYDHVKTFLNDFIEFDSYIKHRIQRLTEGCGEVSSIILKNPNALCFDLISDELFEQLDEFNFGKYMRYASNLHFPAGMANMDILNRIDVYNNNIKLSRFI